ncbi:putative transcriptional regulator [Anaerohalosphaera lusitana]|uniref:Putative transcriptional regulator n=1 Tax=Anaerohalosphaera lusitana TaxID=1936003 RepID=A0A1U9NK57_9BACT|nr:AlpA family phage regulatory protein [Anaerohalosphaera lusitana]AQT68312.1 putative transcriptional regulator [Anaerohalosphaera lusitana]
MNSPKNMIMEASRNCQNKREGEAEPQIRLITAEQFGHILGLSKRQIFRLNATGRVPKPLKIGGAVRWNKGEIHAWLQKGAPDRLTWEAIQSK